MKMKLSTSNTVDAVLGDFAPSSAASRPCSRCRTLTLGSLLRWAGASVILVGGLTSSSSISLSAKFPSGLGTPSRVTMNLGLAESLRSLLMLGNKRKVNVKKTTLVTGQRRGERLVDISLDLNYTSQFPIQTVTRLPLFFNFLLKSNHTSALTPHYGCLFIFRQRAFIDAGKGNEEQNRMKQPGFFF